jgi:hypothetical protein
MNKRFTTRNTFMGVMLTAVSIPCVNAQAPAPAPITLPARWSYAAKFVCGLSPLVTNPNSVPKEPPVKKGNYATVVNIHNTSAADVTILKKVALAAPETFPDTHLIPPTRRFKDRLPSDHAMSVDCSEIVNLLVQNGTPPAGPFIEGFLVVDAIGLASTANVLPELDVVAVTTTAADTTTAVNAIQITPVEGKKLAAGTWAF